MKRVKHGIALLILTSASIGLNAQGFEFLSFMDYYGGIEGSEGYKNLRSQIFMRPKFYGSNETGWLQWELSATLWAQPLGNPSAIDPWDILHTAYLLLAFNDFDISIGQKILSYGFADIFGPLNVLHSTNRYPLSLDDPYDAQRPDPMIQLRFYPSFQDSIELVYVPITRPDRERPGPINLPTSQDRILWYDKPYITDNLHSFFINYSHYGEKIDLQFLYAWYTDHTPDFILGETLGSQSSDIRTTYRKKHSFGFAYSTQIWNMTLSQDFGFNLTEDIRGTDIGAQNSDIIVNTQLLANLPWGILSQYSLIYAFFINHGKHSSGQDTAASSYLAREIQGFHTQPRQHILFLVAHFEKSFLREKLKTALNYGFFFSLEMYFAPRISFAISDYWTIETGADITLGNPPSDDLRRNDFNDNYYLRLIYRF